MWSDWQWMSVAEAESLGSQQRDWLLDQGSLTRRLKRHSKHFRVKLQSLTQIELNARQQAWLSLPAVVSERTVLLEADDKTCIYARSLFVSQQGFTSLGEQPLGERLFADDGWTRGDILLAQVEGSALGLAAQTLWARCSDFRAPGQSPVWVMEVFLPAVFDL